MNMVNELYINHCASMYQTSSHPRCVRMCAYDLLPRYDRLAFLARLSDVEAHECADGHTKMQQHILRDEVIEAGLMREEALLRTLEEAHPTTIVPDE
jgi:hypothetical protein